MKDRFSIIGSVSASLGIILYMIALRFWSINDDTYTTLAPIFAKFIAFFYAGGNTEPSFTSEGFTVTEELSINITIIFAVGLAIIAILCSLLAVKNKENMTLSIASLLFGNSIFIFYNIKLAFITLLLTGCYAIFLKHRPV